MKNDLFDAVIDEKSLLCLNASSVESPVKDDIDFSEMYIAYYSKLIRFATDFVVFEEDAENIVQDVFVSLWERKDTLRCIENMNAYIFKLVKNKCLDHLKHKITQEKYISNIQSNYEQELYLKLQSLEGFDMAIMSEENLDKIITNAINSLPHKCREIFLLSRYRGLKYKEISAWLNLSVNTIETQMGIALKKLRQELKSYLVS